MTREKFNPIANAKNLPSELIQELNLSNQEEGKVIEIFKEGGGILNVSEILIGYYQLYNEVHTRSKMISVLYRMNKKGLIKPSQKRGEYILQEGV